MASVANRVGPATAVATTTQNVSLTVSAGTKRRAIIVCATETASDSINSATFDGNAATPLAAETNFGGMRMRAFEYLIPDVVGAGTYTCSVTKSGAASMSVTAWQLQDCDAAIASVVTSNTAGTGGATVAVSGSANADDVILTAHCNAAAVTNATAASSQVTLGSFAEQSAGFRFGRYDAVGDATETVTVTWTNDNTTTSKTALLVITPRISGPTITAQPVAVTRVLTNSRTATFTVAATGTGGLTYQWQLETGVGTGSYSNVADGSGITWSGGTSTTLTATLTAKTLSGRRVRCRVTDSNGTTDSNAVALTIFDGPQLTAFAPTNGSGVTTATLTCDYVTGTGEAIEVAVILPDGRLAVSTVVT